MRTDLAKSYSLMRLLTGHILLNCIKNNVTYVYVQCHVFGAYNTHAGVQKVIHQGCKQ